MFAPLLAAAMLLPPAQQHDPQLFAYCVGKTTSLGCLPFVRASGIPSETAPLPFLVSAEDGRFGQPGFLLYSTRKAITPFHGGTLCVKAPFSRTDLMPSFFASPRQCSVGLVSHLQLDFNGIIQSGAEPLLTAGQEVHVQWRQMDPGNPWGWDDNLTDALQFTICP